MPPSHLSQSAKPLSGRYLSFEEREEIALLRAQGRGIRHIACRLERAPSTISREVRRNAATRSGGLDYRASYCQKLCMGLSCGGAILAFSIHEFDASNDLGELI